MDVSPTSEDEPARFIEHQGRRLLLIDFERCSPPEMLRRIAFTKAIIGQQPISSVRTLTLCADAHFNDRVNSELKSYTQHNKVYVKRAAVVGVTGLRQILLHGVRVFTGRDIRPFDDIEKAKAWLVET